MMDCDEAVSPLAIMQKFLKGLLHKLTARQIADPAYVIFPVFIAIICVD